MERKTSLGTVNSVQQHNCLSNNNNNNSNNNNNNNNNINNNNNNVNVTRRIVTNSASVPIGVTHHIQNTNTMQQKNHMIGVNATAQSPVTLVRGLSTVSPNCIIGNNANGNANNNTSKEHKKLDRSLSEPAEKSQQNRNQTQTQQSLSGPMSSRYKTELCRSFAEVGNCKYGDKCQFAHGGHELRIITRHPKFKTENCKSFHSTGFCPYGPRCHFIHNSEESKKNILNNLQGGLPNGNNNSNNNSTQSRICNEQIIGGNLINGNNALSSNGFPASYHSNNNNNNNNNNSNSIPVRPKALSIGSYSLGSSGEISPPSSQSGSPTSLNSFFTEDPFNPFASPTNGHVVQRNVSNVYNFNNDFGALGNCRSNLTNNSNSNNNNNNNSVTNSNGHVPFGVSQTMCPPFQPKNMPANVCDSHFPIFQQTLTASSSPPAATNNLTGITTTTPPPLAPQTAPVTYPAAASSPDSISSDVETLRLDQQTLSPNATCSSVRLPIFTRFANAVNNSNNNATNNSE